MTHHDMRFNGRHDVRFGKSISDGFIWCELSLLKDELYVHICHRVVQRPVSPQGVLIVYDPPRELVFMAFQAAMGYMPLDVFADWLESYGKENLVIHNDHDDQNDGGWDSVLAGMRLMCEMDRKQEAMK